MSIFQFGRIKKTGKLLLFHVLKRFHFWENTNCIILKSWFSIFPWLEFFLGEIPKLKLIIDKTLDLTSPKVSPLGHIKTAGLLDKLHKDFRAIMQSIFFPVYCISVFCDSQFLWQDIDIQSQDLDEVEIMQQPSPKSCAQIDSLMQNAS